MGAFLGAVAASGAGGHAFAPASWFWPFVWGCLALGMILLALWGYVGWAEEAFHRSDALDLLFEGDGTPCVADYDGTAGVVPVGTTVMHSPVPTTPLFPAGMWAIGRPARCTLVRLHVRNIRDRRLARVTVRVVEAVSEGSGHKAHPYSDLLKWMHDDSLARPFSTQGREIEPGDDPDSYIDFATKDHSDNSQFVLEFAMPHLRNCPLPAESTFVHLVARAFDERTERRVPDCHRAYRVAVRPDGGLTVTSKTLDECGFAQPISPAARRSPRSSTHGRLPRQPSRGSAGKG
jgi:hypothetical protein